MKSILEIVRKQFPEAVNAVLLNRCDNCKGHNAIFFQGVEDEYVGAGWYSGGVYCPGCDFSNTARVHLDAMVTGSEEPK